MGRRRKVGGGGRRKERRRRMERRNQRNEKEAAEGEIRLDSTSPTYVHLISSHIGRKPPERYHKNR